MLKTDEFGNENLDNCGLEPDAREEALFKEFPDLKDNVAQGIWRVSVNGPRTSIELVSRHFGKMHVPINVEDPSNHEEEFEKLEAQKQIIDAQIAKYPILQQAIDEGWATVKYDHHQGGLGICVNTAVRSVGVTKLDGLGEIAKTDFRAESWFSSASTPQNNRGCVDDKPLSDSIGF
jgi:hypothetical protein